MATLITRSEAAALSGASPTLIKKAVDQKVIPTWTRRSRSYIAVDDVAVLVMCNSLAGLRLPLEYKRRIGRWIRTCPDEMELELNEALVVRKPASADAARERAERYARLRDEWIVRDPDIQAAEPVIRGSRVGVHTLAARIAAGESDEALAEDFPHIPAEARDVALQYANANPRRGRPARSARAT